MTTGNERFDRAIAAFDAANREDPNRETVDGHARPKELLYAERLTAMLARFAPDASRAASARGTMPAHRALDDSARDLSDDTRRLQQWRSRLRDYHAERAGAILRDAGYDDATIGRVRSLIRKEALKTDAEAQTLEDVVALVFMESYLDDFVAKHAGYDEAKFVDILQKTARKMSARGPRHRADAHLSAGGVVAGDPESAWLRRHAAGGEPYSRRKARLNAVSV